MKNFIEKMKSFLSNKSIGYYIAVLDAGMALVFAIIYLATYGRAIGNNAAGHLPEAIAIYMFAAVVIQIAALIVPQYKVLNLGALLMYCLAFAKEVFLFPDFVAGKINNVEYNGGSFKWNLAYFIGLLIIVVSSVVASFFGFYKNKEDEATEMKAIKTTSGIIKAGVAVALIIGAGLSSSLVSSGVEKAEKEKIAAAQKAAEEKAAEEARIAAEEAEKERIRNTFNPITDEIRAAAEAKEYPYDPASLIIKEQTEWDFTDSRLSNLQDKDTRDGHYLVYYFEGNYSEGYQGDYTPTYAHIYLWDDGIFIGKSNDTTFKGFWYNSSIENGTENGADVADCLNMVSNTSKYESIITQGADGFYSKQAYIYLGFSWGTRSIIVAGFLYYPEVAIALNMGVANDHVYHVGDTFSKSTIRINRILKDLNFGSIFANATSTINIPDDMVVDGKLAKAGDFTITASYNGFNTSVTITVVE